MIYLVNKNSSGNSSGVVRVLVFVILTYVVCTMVVSFDIQYKQNAAKSSRKMKREPVLIKPNYSSVAWSSVFVGFGMASL